MPGDNEPSGFILTAILESWRFVRLSRAWDGMSEQLALLSGRHCADSILWMVAGRRQRRLVLRRIKLTVTSRQRRSERIASTIPRIA